MNLGYACINMKLGYPEKGSGLNRITTGRSMIKRTFLKDKEENNLEYVNEICLKNVMDLEKIVKWNIMNGYKFWRIGSDVFPWASEYDLTKLKDFDKGRVGKKIFTDKGGKQQFYRMKKPGTMAVMNVPERELKKYQKMGYEIVE